MTTTPTTAPASPTERAITNARCYRDAAPREFADRHTFRLQWERRAITAAHIAAALDVGVDTVTAPTATTAPTPHPWKFHGDPGRHPHCPHVTDN